MNDDYNFWCDYLHDYHISTQICLCDHYLTRVTKERCMSCEYRRYKYKELKTGDWFYNVETKKYGLKLSEGRYFDYKQKKVFGFYGNKRNTSDRYVYIKANCEVY